MTVWSSIFKHMSILIVILVLLSIFAVVAMQPAQFAVSRSILIDAARAEVFPHVNNLRQWENWSPWAKLDPNAKSEFEGAQEGIGALMRWDGNKDVGQGSMEIIESIPAEFIKFQLIFLKPMAATNYATFRFDVDNDMTKVTWTMTGHNNFAAKAVGLVMNCDKMIGGYFEQGLASLKAVAEQQTA